MLLGFQRRFIPMILDGSKTHTIRAKRKIRPRVGEICHCYVDTRKKTMRLLGRFKCVRVDEIKISEELTKYDSFSVRWPFSAPCPLCDAMTKPDVEHRCSASYLRVRINDEALSPDEVETLFKRDGFPGGSREAIVFWKGRLPFVGDIIHWKPELNR